MLDIDRIIVLVREIRSDIQVRQLTVSHPGADDDGLWFFRHSSSLCEVQIESSDGMCPFLIENDETDERFTSESIENAVQTLSVLLHLA